MSLVKDTEKEYAEKALKWADYHARYISLCLKKGDLTKALNSVNCAGFHIIRHKQNADKKFNEKVKMFKKLRQ